MPSDTRDQSFAAVLGSRRGSGREDPSPGERDWLELRADNGTLVRAVIACETVGFYDLAGHRLGEGRGFEGPASWRVALTKTAAARAVLFEHPYIGEGLKLDEQTVRYVCDWVDERRPGMLLTNPVTLGIAAMQEHSERDGCSEHHPGGSWVARYGTAVIWHDERERFTLGYQLADERSACERYQQLRRAAGERR